MNEIERSNVAGIRKALSALGAVVAEIDTGLRYVWIDNPHPDFEAKGVIGRRDDELIGEADPAEIMSLKQEVLGREAPVARVCSFTRSDGPRYYSLYGYPILDRRGKTEGVLTVAFDAHGLPGTRK